MGPESAGNEKQEQSSQPPAEQGPADQSAERGGLGDFLKGLAVFAALMVPLFAYLIRHELRQGIWAEATPPAMVAPTPAKTQPASDDAATQPAPATAPAEAAATQPAP